jgi:hypothetical protein
MTNDPSIPASVELTEAELSRLLDELASDEDLPTLPADFSRADIYDDPA